MSGITNMNIEQENKTKQDDNNKTINENLEQSENSTLHVEDNDDFGIKVDIGADVDDSELIDAYDRAVIKAKEKLMQRRPEFKQLSHSNKKDDDVTSQSSYVSSRYKGGSLNNKGYNKSNKGSRGKKKRSNKDTWVSGKPCRAVFCGDNKEYEAVICSINDVDGTCEVKFVGYGNREIVPLASLQQSFGTRAVNIQKQQALNGEITSSNAPSELNASFYSASSSEFKNNLQNGTFNFTIPEDFNIKMNHPVAPLPFLANQPIDQSSSLSAVLMSWYMAGYHTGRYEAEVQLRKKGKIGDKSN